MDDTQPPVRARLDELGLLDLDHGAPPDEYLGPLRRWAATLNGSQARREAERDRVVALLGEIGVNAPARMVKAAVEDATSGNAPDEMRSDSTFGDRIVDIVRTDRGLRWLTVGDGGVEFAEQIGDRTPWSRTALPWKAVPDAENVRSHLRDGAHAPIRVLAEFIESRVVLPDPATPWSWLLAAWSLGTYLLPEFAYYPVILLQGPPERGKTRLGKAVLWPSYRGYFTASPTAATVFRDRAFHRCTLMLDVEDVEEVLDRSDLGDLILQGFERGGVVRRCTHPDAEPREQIETFDAYGATILTSNEPIRADRPLATRCIPVRLPEARDADVPDAATPDDAAAIRAKATAWAAEFRASGESLPEADLSLNGRMADLSRPLVRLVRSASPGRAGEVIELLHHLDHERRQETAESWEARVAIALWAAFEADDVESGRVYVQDVRKHANEGRPEEERLTSQQVGMARKKLGLRKGRGGARGRTYIRWPGEEEARQLRDRYSPTSHSLTEFPKEGSERSVSSEPPEKTGTESTEDRRPVVQREQRAPQRDQRSDQRRWQRAVQRVQRADQPQTAGDAGATEDPDGTEQAETEVAKAERKECLQCGSGGVSDGDLCVYCETHGEAG